MSGSSGNEAHRSYVEEQYPTLVKNNQPRPSDLARMRNEASAFAHKPLLSLLMPIAQPEIPRLQRTLDSVMGQVYPYWELIACRDASAEEPLKETLARYERLDERIKVSYPEQAERGASTLAGLSNAALSLATGEFVSLLGEGDELSPEALFEVVQTLQGHPEADLLYSDEDLVDEQGSRYSPRFKPDWSPDLLLSGDYISRLSVYRVSLLEELEGYREGFEGAEDYDLVLRATERARQIVHLPKVLYHRATTTGAPATYADGEADASRRALSDALERRGIEGEVEEGLLPGTFRVRREIIGDPRVSILMPTKDHAHLLKACIESIERLTDYPNYEILIIDNDSTEPATLEYLEKTPHRVIPFREQYNHPKINNMAAAEASGEYVVLLNDDTEVISGGWLRAMLEHAQRSEVGAVGARLLYPDGRVQHAGVVTAASTWTHGTATHAYQFYSSEDPGHLGTLFRTANYSAVTAACMMARKSVYEEVGGLDENLRVSFDDVDLCLRMREMGYLVVYTPYAELYHHESVTLGRGVDKPSEDYMMELWEKKLHGDPYYNPHFSRGLGDFNLRADLLRPRALRRPSPPGDKLLLSGPRLLRMRSDDRDEYLARQRKATRDSSRTSLVPRKGPRLAESALLETLEDDEAPVPERRERARVAGEPANRGAVRGEQLVWVFGSPRTGSTWLSKIMAELDDQQRWNEPYVGLLFGSFIHERLDGAKKLLSNPSFILSDRYHEVWLESLKGFVLDGASARYPDLAPRDHLVIKEPNGSVGASMLMEAIPQSRMVFLMRDPRDVVASRLDAVRRGGWTGQERELGSSEKLEAFTRHLAEDYLRSVSQVQEAYDSHLGKKAFVRYEDLREDTVGVMRAMYEALGIPVDEARLEAAISKHSWEAIPEEEKGEGKFYRKARPEGWREDLIPAQVRIIEEVTASVLEEYYPSNPSSKSTPSRP